MTPSEPEGLPDDVELSPISVADAGEVLTVQRAAFVSEAQIYGSADMPPLTQTLEELEAELRQNDGWVARVGGRLVGALRSREADGLLLIGRIAIAPDMQGSGIGRALLGAAESHSGAQEAELPDPLADRQRQGVGHADQGPQTEPGVVDGVPLEVAADRLGLGQQRADVGTRQPARHQAEGRQRGEPAAHAGVGPEDPVARLGGRLVER